MSEEIKSQQIIHTDLIESDIQLGIHLFYTKMSFGKSSASSKAHNKLYNRSVHTLITQIMRFFIFAIPLLILGYLIIVSVFKTIRLCTTFNLKRTQ